MKKFGLTVILMLLLVICVPLCACSKSDAAVGNNGIVVTTSLKDREAIVGNIPCTFPLLKEPGSLTIIAANYPDTDYNNLFVWNKYEQMTNIDVNWIQLTRAERDESVYYALINKTAVDLLIRCRIPSNKLTQYGEGGLILNLQQDDLLKNNAPNCYAYLYSHPETLASVMNPDGSIYSIPQVNSGAELRVSRKLFINKQWLKNVNMEIPKTTEELYKLLKAFKEQDANGNGDPHDEIPLSPIDFVSLQDTLWGAFGLGNRGVHNTIIDYNEALDDVRLIAASSSYKQYLEYLSRLYKEGLLDNSCFTVDSAQWANSILNDRIGIFAHTNLAKVPASKANDWVAVDEALEGPNGDKLWTAIRANFHSVGAAVIPTTCKNPELALKWLDYFWTDEGTLFYHMGIEGETFTADSDGSYQYMDNVFENTSTALSFDDTVAQYSPYPGGGNPTVETAPYFMGGEMAAIPADAARKLINYGPSEYWPCFTFTAKENDALNIITQDLEKYIASSRLEFITGKKSFSEWDSYLEHLNKLKSEELLEIYRKAVDRYYELLKTIENSFE